MAEIMGLVANSWIVARITDLCVRYKGGMVMAEIIGLEIIHWIIENIIVMIEIKGFGASLCIVARIMGL